MAKNGKASSNGKAAHWVGKKLKRKEDPRLIQGISHYTDDLKMAGMVYCALVRSPAAPLAPAFGAFSSSRSSGE